VTKFRHFELINSEKITPEFVKLAKSINTDYSLADICNDDGSPFQTESDRKKFSKEFFADIYKKPPCDVNREPNLIEKFFGEDVLSHPLISKSKLTEDDKKLLDLPLTIAEIDKALNEANKKSAPLTV
jgi:hypothetical protein